MTAPERLPLENSPVIADVQAPARRCISASRPVLVCWRNYGFPPILAEPGLNLTAMVAGRQAPPSPFGFVRFLPWAMRGLVLIPVLQIAGVAATLLRLRGWRENPEHIPTRGRLWTLHILLPLIPNLSLAALPIYLKAKGMLRYLKLFNPDAAWVALICGSFAGIWALVRTGLILRGSSGRRNPNS